MEETSKKFPSLPANYVSLQQLQELRLREQKQRQKEKEEEEQKLKEEEENERRKKEEEEEVRRPRESHKNLGVRAKTLSIWIDRKDWRKGPRGCDRRKEEETDSKLKSRESEIAVAVEGGNTDLEQKLEELRKKPRKKRYKKKKKHKEWMKDDAGNGDLNGLPSSENDRNEVILIPSSVAKKQAAASPEKAKETTPTAEIVGRIAVLSVADHKKAAETDGYKRVNGNRSAVTVNPGFRSSRRKSSVKQTAEVAQRAENPTAEMVGRIAVLSVDNDLKTVETDCTRSMAVANPGFQSSRRKSSVKRTAEVERRTENPGFRSSRRKSSVKQTAEVAQRAENPTAEMVGRIAVLSVGNDLKAVETDCNRSMAVANPGFQSSRRKSSVKRTAEVERRTENPMVGGDPNVVETGGEKVVNGSDSTVAMNALNGGGRRRYWSTRRFGYRGNTRDANLVWVKKGESEDKNTKKPIGSRFSGSRLVDA